MLKTTRDLLQKFEGMTEEERLQYANVCPVEDLEVLADYYCFECNNGLVTKIGRNSRDLTDKTKFSEKQSQLDA